MVRLFGGLCFAVTGCVLYLLASLNAPTGECLTWAFMHRATGLMWGIALVLLAWFLYDWRSGQSAALFPGIVKNGQTVAEGRASLNALMQAQRQELYAAESCEPAADDPRSTGSVANPSGGQQTTARQ
jgi:hypothetical protein